MTEDVLLQEGTIYIGEEDEKEGWDWENILSNWCRPTTECLTGFVSPCTTCHWMKHITQWLPSVFQ